MEGAIRVSHDAEGLIALPNQQAVARRAKVHHRHRTAPLAPGGSEKSRRRLDIFHGDAIGGGRDLSKRNPGLSVIAALEKRGIGNLGGLARIHFLVFREGGLGFLGSSDTEE